MRPQARSGARWTRRSLLRAGAAGSVIASAGCTALSGSNGSEDTWSEGGPADREGWQVTFADRFDDGTLDWEVWSLGAWAEGRCAGGSVDVCFAEDHIRVDDDRERLVLEASTETPEPPADARPPERDNDYTVGAVTTKDAFAQAFGYFEVKARLPDEPGTLPACWLFCQPADYDWREIDIVEKMGATSADTVSSVIHVEDDGPGTESGELLDEREPVPESGFDATVDPPANEAFHIYAVHWGPDRVEFRIDDEAIGRITDAAALDALAGQPLFWILNHSVHEPSEWLGDPADATFPSAVEVDWVRTWQHEDWV